jgi:hypothetical protein
MVGTSDKGREPPTIALRDELDASAVLAVSLRRRIGQGAVAFAVGPFGNRFAAEVKIAVLGIAAWPAARIWGERADLLGGGRAWIGDGGCRGVCLLRRRLDEEGSGRLRCGAAVCPGGARDGSLLDLIDRNRSGGQEAEHDADAAGNAAIAIPPTSHAPRTDAEQLGDAVLREAERVECLVKFGH